MAHTHSVYDSDTHFTINPITRALRNTASSKTSVIQFDHNSERFTFEIPRIIEGHDMSTCNTVQVHYINIDATTKAQIKGMYEVDDMQISPNGDDVVICSWLISNNATQLVGPLDFLVRFACVSEDGTVDYVWNTAVYTGIGVSSGIDNGNIIAEEYPDILAQWKAELEQSKIVDATLTIPGAGADAKETGDRFGALENGTGYIDVSTSSAKTFTVADDVNATHVVSATEEVSRPTVGFYGDDGDQPVCLTNIATPVNKRDVANKHYVDNNMALTMENGVVKTFSSGTVEPYLNEWGWKCCEADGEKAMALYRWLYQCMDEGLHVPVRYVDDGEEVAPFITDGKRSGCEQICADIIEKCNFIAANGQLVPAGENIVNAVMADDYVTFLKIPVVQFGISDEREFYYIAHRVVLDNTHLYCPLFPAIESSVPIIKNANGICEYIYTVAPTNEKRAQMIDICNAEVKKITDLIFDLYGVEPGYKMSVSTKVKVAKVIHDWIVLHGNFDGQTVEWWQPTPYAVYDSRYKGVCMSYTLAFNHVARMYGIESIYMSGHVYVDINADGDKSDYGESGSHAWVAVRLSDDEYGTYPNDPKKWSCIDLYWDEPRHETSIGGVPDREDIMWKYFMQLRNILPKPGTEPYNHTHRIIDTTTGYGKYPLVDADGNPLEPTTNYLYGGDEPYTWED